MTMNNARSLPLEEQLSALVDGELAPDALTPLLAELSRQDKLREDWYVYHVVGDVLRSAALAPSAADAAFLGRLEQRLAAEPTRPTQGLAGWYGFVSGGRGGFCGCVAAGRCT
jgi:negative regulator of sigma E activity